MEKSLRKMQCCAKLEINVIYTKQYIRKLMKIAPMCGQVWKNITVVRCKFKNCVLGLMKKIELSHVESNFGGISCVHTSLEK